MSALQFAGCHSSWSSWRDLGPAWLLVSWLRALMKMSSGEAVVWVRCGCSKPTWFIGGSKPWRGVMGTPWSAAAAGSRAQSEPCATVCGDMRACWAQKEFQSWLRCYIKLFRWESSSGKAHWRSLCFAFICCRGNEMAQLMMGWMACGGNDRLHPLEYCIYRL